jgi:phage terminase small subunit
MSDESTVREELFIAGVVGGKTLTQAAIDAGYAPNSADVTAQRIIKRPHVARAIQAAKERIAKQHKVTAERALEEFAVIGFSDITHYTIDGQPIADFLGLTPDAPKNAMRAVKKVKRTVKNVRPRDGDPYTETDTEVEFWSKDSATKNIGDYLKLFKENRADEDDESDLTDDQLRERVISILKVAKKRKMAAAGGKQTA